MKEQETVVVVHTHHVRGIPEMGMLHIRCVIMLYGLDVLMLDSVSSTGIVYGTN